MYRLQFARTWPHSVSCEDGGLPASLGASPTQFQGQLLPQVLAPCILLLIRVGG